MHISGVFNLTPLVFIIKLSAADPGAPIPPTAWSAASKKASDFVSQLDLSEKIGIVSGGYNTPSLPCVGAIGAVKRLGFNGLCLSDGPTGYSRSDGASVFPSGITTAATWDKHLMYERAVALGEEFKAKGAHVHLGPSTGPLGRSARAGRNWESFGPDPYLAGVAMDASVRGIQSRTNTTLDDGTIIEGISSNIDDRTLHELYIWPFANSVHAGTSSIMCAYNRVNGNYSCANSNILQTILKDELAFPGYIVSDWYATHSTADSANTGLDMEMPGNVSALAGPAFFGTPLLEAVNGGMVNQSRLDDMAKRVMAPYFLLGQDQNYPTVDPSSGAVFSVYQYGHGYSLPFTYPEVEARGVRGNHSDIIRQVGAAGTVLLKNKNGALPLKDRMNIGLFGNDVSYPVVGSVFRDIGDSPEGYEMGTLDVGGGSGTVRHTKLVTPLEAIQKRVESTGGRVQMLFDNDIVAGGLFRTIYPTPDACLLFLKAFATEGSDRSSLELQWNATMAVESTAAMCPNTIVVTHGPGVVLMPWADNENVTAILAAHYPGEETGNSIVDILWGATEPSGQLPYTVPRNASDYGAPIVDTVVDEKDPNAWQSDFVEGQMIDYRHFDAYNIDPLYEFGFGLSYTTFEMGDILEVEIVDGPLSPIANISLGMIPGGLQDLWTTCAIVKGQVTNSGDRAGFVVPQLYLSLPQESTPAGTPLKVLRGFEKIFLEPGEGKEVKFELMRRDLSFWDVNEQMWVIPTGAVNFLAGFSSRDIKAETKFSLID
ncbi:glycoside hydrolase family 3 protein [Aaosphaeria arxii CBS 175.79]|uniref:Probable beta-glucosidase G n=1 Tax=Aaosphaeria arxii CBS 175.79 TaxID=1450172 RepID=A0A6A5X7B7_9PLEO|nr:glycoside hydrolase family 3 protein [Aaosphaeria arxii CBS 175.79]KAF2008822.1 glycoside hydrolase family 3 protein [Aaosphaeria arxii CBS 175.79]